MTSYELDVVAVGNALVDVLANIDESFVNNEKQNGMVKGAMTLIDEERARALYAKMPPSLEVSGGSAANTMAGFASFGGNGGFIGKVAKDQLGEVFTHDLKNQGLVFKTPALDNGPATGRCLILVTPDAQRTMNTYLGASIEMSEDDIDEKLISQAAITYLEGYLFDRDQAKKAFEKAGEIAHKSGNDLALTLSDVFCVERHREDFQRLVDGSVDILFANEQEIMALYETDNFMEACQKAAAKCRITAVTRGEKGSLVISGEEKVEIKAMPPEKLVDTTGAGDLYAAGFLYGLSRNKSHFECGRLGTLAATEVISHMGPRPQTSLQDLASQAV